MQEVLQRLVDQYQQHLHDKQKEKASVDDLSCALGIEINALRKAPKSIQRRLDGPSTPMEQLPTTPLVQPRNPFTMGTIAHQVYTLLAHEGPLSTREIHLRLGGNNRMSFGTLKGELYSQSRQGRGFRRRERGVFDVLRDDV